MQKILLIAAAWLLASASWSLDLDSAKAQGLVGEQTNGYVGLVVKANPAAVELVTNINLQRQAKYQEIAAKRGTSLSTIENLAGSKLIEKAAADQHYYQTSSGSWAR